MPQVDTRHATGWTTRWGLREWQEFYLGRPDQLSLDEWRKLKTCDFHTKPQRVIRAYDDIAGGMVLQGALHRSHTEHLVTRPKNGCWPVDQIHNMGGRKYALTIYQRVILPLIEERKVGQTFVAKYAGKSAGMSQPDDHTHILLNPESATIFAASSGPEAIRDLRASKAIITETGNIRMVCYPVFSAGQCWMVAMDGSGTKIEDVVDVLTTTNDLFAKKFRSKQGLPPDWSIHLRFLGTNFVAGHYTPRITTPGTEQAAACLFNDIAVAHQCPPDEVLEILGIR